ncbi:MAG: hypothetical protein FH753_02025 [Firmicutes bacterium]|nr:hypothetical protein [Bacillota bacterium]
MTIRNMLNSKALRKSLIEEVLKSNEKIKKYGLLLTVEDVNKIMETRNRALQSYGRIELEIRVTKMMIEKFSDSSYIDNENFVFILNELQDVFYYFKNETEDKISDNKLIDILKEYFENSCEGSIELLKSKLEVFAQEFRKKTQMKDSLDNGGVY